MGKAKITITGTPEMPPKLNKDGNMDLLFKTSMSVSVPKGLTSMGDSFALVHVAPKTWKKVADALTPTSEFIISGEAHAKKNNKDMAFFDVLAFDIMLKPENVKKDKDVVKVVQTPVRVIEPISDTQTDKKGKHNKVSDESERVNLGMWYASQEQTFLHSKDIVCIDSKHLYADSVNFKGSLKYMSLNRKLTTPIVVRPIDNGKYALTMGFKNFIIAKMLDLENVPVIITELGHQDIMKASIAMDKRRGEN